MSLNLPVESVSKTVTAAERARNEDIADAIVAVQALRDAQRKAEQQIQVQQQLPDQPLHTSNG